LPDVNRLADETSPYLRQHRDNPVDWYPWGPEAFAAATQRDRPILLSVGYSACHWCHVMAHECFEDDETAALMNRSFVNIKVDREERPDVDSVYMEAVQALTGRGGWPMTVFMTADGHPFFGGTYFPKPQFDALLSRIDEVWTTERQALSGNIEALATALQRSTHIEPAGTLPGIELLGPTLAAIGQNFDSEWGGFGGAPKFPSTMTLELVVRNYADQANDGAATVVTTSLDAMASGGVYDHLGGGFARYSVDTMWLVPHFEKMLYDQALLARIFLHGWQVFGHDRWLQVLDETIGYVLGQLGDPGGGFYSAEDADSPDEDGRSHEGLFYVWTAEQIRATLPGELAEAAIEWYEVTPEGNFDGATILARLHHRGELLRPDAVEQARRQLLEARSHRARPLLDDKVLTEWNGLMLTTLAEAAAATQRADWLQAALNNGNFLLGELRRADGRWHRSWQRDGGPRHDALAADHAAVVCGFVALAEASGQARWIEAARQTADTMLDHFWDATNGGLFTTADDGEALIVRQKDLIDQATPSANSLAAHGLYRLAALTGEGRYANLADQIVQLAAGIVPGAPTAFSHLLAAHESRLRGLTEVAVVGDRPDLVHAVQRRFAPHSVLAWGEPYDSPLWASRHDGFAYVCRNYACQVPVDTVEALTAQLDAP
jgi:uncharacterized protein